MADKSKVFFYDARAKAGSSLSRKLLRLLGRARLRDRVPEGGMVAVKLHWGEPGNTGYLRPVFARTVVDNILEVGGRPFVTDTNVLYRGKRHDALDNLAAAAMNGFTRESMGAPILVADGLKGHDGVDVEIPHGERVKTARIAAGIHAADAMVCLSHVKGHLLFGFGGALKNLGMGCATAAGKHVLHADVKPRVDQARCVGCRVCFEACPEEAITFWPTEVDGVPTVRAQIEEARCVGCGECVIVCPKEAIPVNWDTSQAPLVEKTAEYAWAALAGKRERALFVNFLLDIVPDCDCCNWTDLPIVPDLGVLVSTDPVAIDQASVDLVNQAPLIPGCAIDDGPRSGDHFMDIHGHEYEGLLAHAEKLGLGSRAYDLV